MPNQAICLTTKAWQNLCLHHLIEYHFRHNLSHTCNNSAFVFSKSLFIEILTYIWTMSGEALLALVLYLGQVCVAAGVKNLPAKGTPSLPQDLL